MVPWKKFLPKSANFSKFEKEEKQKYKQYVKIEKQNVQLRSKPEAEVYEDYFFSRVKSFRRSSKKRKTPAPRAIENAYEIIEGQPSSNNVVVINDDLRSRFSGYELPKLQDNIYVLVQPHEAQVEIPKRLRWKKSLPAPPQNEIPSNHGKLKEKTKPKPKSPEEALRVPEDDTQDTSMSEVYYDCEEYMEIPSRPPTEALKESREPLHHNKTTGCPMISRTVDGHPNLPNPNYDSISEIGLPLPPRNRNYDSTSEPSLTRSYDVEYAEYEELYDSQRIYNRYSNEGVGPEDESRWQPSNVRFCEMSGDEDEQQIYGPFGTFEVSDYKNTLNNRIQMVLESERHAVMLSLEGQRAADEIDGVEMEKVFELSGTDLEPNEEDFGAAGGFEKQKAEAKNVALIEVLEEPKRDTQRLQEPTSSTLPLEVHEETQRDKNIGHHLISISSNLHHEAYGKPLEGNQLKVDHQLKVPSPTNLHEEIHKEIKRPEDVEHHQSIPIPSKPSGINEVIFKRKEGEERKETATLPQVSSPLEKGYREDAEETATLPPQVSSLLEKGLEEDASEIKKSTHLSSSSFRLIDNYSSFLKDPMSMMMPRLNSSFKVEQQVPKPKETEQRKEDGVEYQNLQTKPILSKEKSPPPFLKKSEDTKSMETPPPNLRFSSNVEEDNPKSNGIIQGKEDGVAYKNLEFKPSIGKEKSPSPLKKSMDPKLIEIPPPNLRPSSEVEEDNPKPNETIQAEEDGFAYENLQFTSTMNEEKSSLPSKISVDSKSMEMPPPNLRFSSNVEEDNLKPKGTIQGKEDGVAYENLQFKPSIGKEESMKMHQSSLRPFSKIQHEDPKSTHHEDDNTYENLEFNQSVHTKESPPHLKNSQQDPQTHYKNPVAQPRLSLFNRIRNRDLRQNESDLVPTRNTEERPDEEAGPENATFDLFNGLPVEAEELGQRKKLFNKQTDKEDQNGRNWAKNANSGLYNGLPVESEESMKKADANTESNLRIPWETKPKMPPRNADTFTYFSTWREEEVRGEIFEEAWNTRPKTSATIENTPAFSSNAKEGEIQNEILEIPWEIKPEVPPTVFHNNVEEEEIPREIPWGTRPETSSISKGIFASFGEAFQDDPKKSKQEKIGGHEHVKVDWDSEASEGNETSMISLDTRLQNSRKNRRSSGFSDSNFDDQAFCNEPTSSNELPFIVKLSQNNPGNDLSSQNKRDEGIRSPFKEKGSFLDKPTDTKEAVSDTTEGDQKVPSNDIDGEAEKDEIQNEATILEENYRLLRGFNVAREEGVVYHDVHNPSGPPQRPFKKSKIPKKVSFRISETPESPNVYVPAHSPTEANGHIKRSAKLEAITRKLEETAYLKHSISLTEPEKPKPNFSTFPRNTSRIQNLPKSEDLERLQLVLSSINDLVSVHEQVSAMEDVSSNVKDRVDKFDRSGGPENEYSELLQIMYRSVRIVTVLECGFDPVLLTRQQTLIDEIRNSMSILNSK